MESYQINGLNIIVNKDGAREYAKVSYPIRYGRYSEIRTQEYLFQFNLNGEIKTMQGLGSTWPDPLEWLKRTMGDDWVYYSTGGYGGIHDAFGEYYLPCPAYPTNAITLNSPFDDPAVGAAIHAWQALQRKIEPIITNVNPRGLKDFLTSVIQNDQAALSRKSVRFHKAIGQRASVLPPDTRHVDYEVIPITISDGCLYNCGFCRVKSGRAFANRTRQDISDQLQTLKEIYGSDIKNYNSIFLGQHDALNSGTELIVHTAQKAYEWFELDRSNMKGCNMFLFGSVDSLLNAETELFETLEGLPYSTYINIGLESPDPNTLAVIKKSITAEAVDQAFARMIEINKTYRHIEITANFLFGDELPQSHMSAFLELIERWLKKPYGKGTIYFSPLVNRGAGENRGMLRKFYKVKALSPIPAYIYLIQRL